MQQKSKAAFSKNDPKRKVGKWYERSYWMHFNAEIVKDTEVGLLSYWHEYLTWKSQLNVGPEEYFAKRVKTSQNKYSIQIRCSLLQE